MKPNLVTLASLAVAVTLTPALCYLLFTKGNLSSDDPPLIRLMRGGYTRLLRAIDAPDGERVDLALTTNGSLLAPLAAGLRSAGLDRITVSLDSLD